MSSKWLLPNATKDKQSITSDWNLTNLRLIQGVDVKEIKNVPKNNGSLVEVIRPEWLGENKTIGQVFQVMLRPNGISAWHAHEQTTDRLFVNRGLVKIVLYDAREDSPTFGMINEFRIGTERPALLTVPPKVWHGVQNISNGDSLILNLVDIPYTYENPDHWRVETNCTAIPYKFKNDQAI